MISASAPGRVELLGNHTDYNEGVVLAGAIDREVVVSGEPLATEEILLSSEMLGRTVRVPLGNLQPLGEESWANYCLGVAQAWQRSGLPLRGFRASIRSNLPPGSGLSSSAALEVATACFLLQLHENAMPPLDLARLCRRAENDFVGVPSGLLDQATSVFGRKDHLVFLDCRSEEVRTVPFPADLVLVVADTGIRHRLVESEYGRRRAECQAAALQLQVHALREATPARLAAASIDATLHRRAAHIVGENDRVWKALGALAIADGVTFGRLMNESHESSRTLFENSTPELDLLVEEARALPGVLGARLTGGGFGGSTVTLVQAAHVEEAMQSLDARFRARTGRSCTPLRCRLADGAVRA